MLHSIQKSPLAYYFIYTLTTCRLKAAFHTILLCLYMCVKLEAEFSTINLRSKHSNACTHVSFHPVKSCCILFYIYTCIRTCVDLKQHFIQYCCPCTCVCSKKRIFDQIFPVQTFKYLLACVIPPRKVLLHIILYIHLHIYVST